MILLKLLLIALVNVMIIDLTDFIPSVKRLLSRLLTKGNITTDSFRIKPLDCSLCMTFWCSLLYIISSGQFTLFNLAYICILAFLTDSLRQMLLLIKDTLNKLIDKYYELFIDKTR